MSPSDIGSVNETDHRSSGEVGGALSAQLHAHRTPVTFKAILTIGHLALMVAAVSAYMQPATGYELSIYSQQNTAMLFWYAAGVGLLSALIVALYSRQSQTHFLALVLGGASMTAVVGLPLIRGYYFFGQTDPLIHLGWAQAIAGGTLTVTEILYPGSHVSAVLLGDLTGLGIRLSMMLLVVAFAVVYFLFVPLAARMLVSDRLTMTVATFSGFMLLPLNNVSTFLRFHPSSLALLFLPFAFYILLRHLISENRAGWGLASGTGVTVVVVGIAVLLFHPQVMLNYLIMLGAIAAYQLYQRRTHSGSIENRLSAVSLHFLLLGVLFSLWISGHWQLETTIEQTRTALLNIGGGGSVGQVVDQRAASASEIGANLPELFVKLFAVSTVYLTLAVVFVLDRLRSNGDYGPTGRADIYRYLFYGGLALLPLIAVNYVGKVSTYFFRHLGFAMVFATIIGAVAIPYFVERGLSNPRSLALRPIIATVLVVGLVLSVAVLYPSPFIYLPNHQVTEAQMGGYETAFENQPPDAGVWFGAIRITSNRYESALIDAPRSVSSGPVPGPALANPREYYAHHPEPSIRRDHYVVVATYDVKREVEAYQQLRYTADEIDSIENRRGVHRIFSNGEFTLYYVDLPGEANE